MNSPPWSRRSKHSVNSPASGSALAIQRAQLGPLKRGATKKSKPARQGNTPAMGSTRINREGRGSPSPTRRCVSDGMSLACPARSMPSLNAMTAFLQGPQRQSRVLNCAIPRGGAKTLTDYSLPNGITVQQCLAASGQSRPASQGRMKTN